MIKEFQLWRWTDKKRDNDEYRNIPIDAYNHSMDSIRYYAILKWMPKSSAKLEYKKPPKRVMGYQLIGRKKY